LSEHMKLSGNLKQLHSPNENDNGMAYCSRCKKVAKKADLYLHEGGTSQYIQLVCQNCKKTIWISELELERIKDDEKCYVCKKPTNYYDSVCVSYGPKFPKNGAHFCSERCVKQNEKQRRGKRK
jgi:hypothetical protein